MRIIARWGVALGVALAAWTLFVHVMGWYTTNLAAGRIADRVVIVLPIAAIALALHHRARGGVRPLGFVAALGVGAGVGLISAIVFTPFLWWYHHFMNPAWLDHVIAFERGRLAGVGTAAADIERAIETTRRGATDVAQITGGFVGSLILCVVTAALSWALMRGAGALRARSASG